MTEEIIDRIEQYLNGKFSPAEKESFEAELRSNEELRKQVDFIKNLPHAVQAHTESGLRKQLQDFEQTLPKVEYQTEKEGGVSKVVPLPKSDSAFQWARYAVAASILLVVGLFIFRDNVFNSNNRNQVATNNTDTLNTISGLEHLDNRQISVSSLIVTKVEDGKLGFVKNSLEKKITLIIEVDSTILNDGSKYGLYRLQSDSLFLLTEKLETKISVFEFNVMAQHGQMMDSTGQLLEYEKPALIGTYISGLGSYFKIENKKDYSPLAEVKESEKELLKFYTR